MKAWQVILGVILCIVVPISVGIYLEQRKQEPISVSLSLVLPSSAQPNAKVELSEKSLTELRNTIEKNMLVANQERLIQTFNDEKANYMNLLTVISVLLTVFSLFAILSSFIDKSEFQKLSSEMKLRISEYEEELRKMHFNSLVADIRRHQTGFQAKTVSLVFEDGSQVSDADGFRKYVSQTIQEIFRVVHNRKLEGLTDSRSFFLEYFNLTIYTIDYANTNKFESNVETSVPRNPIFRDFVSTLHSNVDKSVFEKYKQFVSGLTKCDWGKY